MRVNFWGSKIFFHQNTKFIALTIVHMQNTMVPLKTQNNEDFMFWIFFFQNLKLGGVWINLGPLLYHYSDIPGEHSIEPTYEMVMDAVRCMGFVVEVSAMNE